MLRRLASGLARAALHSPRGMSSSSCDASASFLSRLADPTLLRTDCLVAGAWTGGSAARIHVHNPATGELLASVPNLGAAEAAAAVGGAAAAQPAWAALPPSARAAILRKWHALMVDNISDLAAIMTAEQGKPAGEARGEVQYSADYLLWFAEEAVRNYGDTIPSVAPGHFGITLRQPVGVAALITPWNFPTAMLARKAGAALAAGCTAVAKPSELTPLSALAFAELGLRAGLPPCVLSVVTGDAAPLGTAFTSDPRIRKLSFTGSTRVGKLLGAACAATHMQRTSLELGGNAPFLVFDDADPEAAAAGALASKFRNSGQTCVCANRFYVQDGIYEVFAAYFKAKIEALVLGDGASQGVTLGPLINSAAVAKCKAHVADALERGARLVLGGKVSTLLGRTFFEPTLLVNVPPDSLICREEVFGPVAALVRFSTEEEALRWANDSDAGLAAYVYTRDAGRLWRVGGALEAGMVGLNSGNAAGCVAAPFGGVKGSGHGREGSRHGMAEYQEVKYLSMAVA